jgi:hypothetical protein
MNCCYIKLLHDVYDVRRKTKKRKKNFEERTNKAHHALGRAVPSVLLYLHIECARVGGQKKNVNDEACFYYDATCLLILLLLLLLIRYIERVHY